MNNYIKKELVNISEIHVIRFLFNNILKSYNVNKKCIL